MSEFKIEVDGGATVRLPTGGKYCPQDILVTGKGGDTEAAYNEGYTAGVTEGAEVGYAKGKTDGEQNALDAVNIELSGRGLEEVASVDEISITLDEAFITLESNGYESGKKAEYDAFWDAIQNFGNREIYYSCFCGKGWNNDSFKPKYDIVPTNANYLFDGCGEIDLIGVLERSGVVMDFSKCTSFNYMLRNDAQIKHFPPIDLSAASHFNDGFRYAPNLESCSFVNVKPVIQWSNSFANCTKLVDVTISGEIGKAISFAQSSKLSTASVQSIIDALADLTGASAQTLTFHTTVGGNMTQAQKDAISAKNWTLVY